VTRRAAWAALIFIGAIIITPLECARSHSFVPDGTAQSQPVAPFNEVLFLENILVIGTAPYQDERFNSQRAHGPLYDIGGGGGDLDYSASFDGPRRKEKRLGGASIDIFGWGDRSGWTPPIDLYCHIPSRRTAAIFPSRLHSEASDYELGKGAIPFGFPLRTMNADSFHIGWSRQIGTGCQFIVESIEKNEGALSGLKSSLPGLSQLVSCYPQSECECGYSNACQSGEKSVVSINKGNRADDLSPDDADDDWAFFLSVCIALIGGGLAYAGLKMGCDLIFGKNK
jgi:hypothetical protein